MIPVREQPSPADFDVKVTTPGLAFLTNNPNPPSWKNREYWQQTLPDLWRAYSGICAYTCTWIPPDLGAATVDHFEPKSINPKRAYDWRNYRLASPKMNRNKGTFTDVLDPFTLDKDWFVLDFSTMLIKPGAQLSATEKQQVLLSIARLKLNIDEPLINTRLRWILEYCDNHVSFSYLQRHVPFIAYELERQNLQNSIGGVFRRRRL